MRFRLATTGQQAPNFGAGFAALGALPMMRAQAAEEAERAAADRAYRAAQTRSAEAQAALYSQKAEAERQGLERGSLGELLKSAALMNRVPLHQAGEAADFFQSGQLQPRYELPGGMQGPTLPTPQYADPDVGAQIMETLGLLRGGLTAGGNIEQITGAQGDLQKQSAVRNVIANPGMAGRTGQAFAAVDGKPLIQNVGTSGRSFNQFTGEGGTIDPGMAALFDQGERAGIGQKNASAASSYASAGAAQALEEQRRQEIERGAKSGDIQTVTAPDGAVYLVNKVTGETRQAVRPDGLPVLSGKGGATGSGAGGGKPMTEGQAKANMFGGRMLESDQILRKLEDSGVTDPGLIKSTVQGVAGLTPFIGDKLGEAAGSVMNVAPGFLGGPSSEQQQTEQARRDFINAVLRRESGAVISPTEFSNADRQYFPQPGDSKAVIDQKRRNREIALNLMLQEVPEHHRYRQGSIPTTAAPAAPTPPAAVKPEGSWGPPTAPPGFSIRRIN